MKIGDKVVHTLYGTGVITDGVTEPFIKIRFGREEKTFPQSFFATGHLKWLGSSSNERGKNTPPTRKSSSNQRNETNLFFKCNYCDGGESGFCGMCSDETIAWNLKKGRDWCQRSECAAYLRLYTIPEKIQKREEMEQGWKNGESFCMESVLLRDWIFSGEGKICNVTKGSLAVFTTEPPSRKGREIFALFLVDDVAIADDGNTWVRCNALDCRLYLTTEERAALQFTDYYQTQWSSGLFRYFDDFTAKRILEDLYQIAYRPQVAQLYRNYCSIHPHLHLNEELLETGAHYQLKRRIDRMDATRKRFLSRKNQNGKNHI